MLKYSRNYVLQVEIPVPIQFPAFGSPGNKQFLTIKPPFTVEIDSNVGMYSENNHGSIKIYNLSKIHRDSIRKDFNTNPTSVTMQAGYGENLPLILNANVMRAWSVREGVNYITQIDFNIGMVANATGVTNTPFHKGTSLKTIMENLALSLPGISGAVIGNYASVSKRGSAYSGNTASILQEISNGGFVVGNDNKAYCLNDDEVVEGTYPLINEQTGLLGTPTRFEYRVYVEVLFEARLQLFQLITLESSTDPSVNGNYKVVGFRHKAMFSETVCGSATTSVTLEPLKSPVFVS